MQEWKKNIRQVVPYVPGEQPKKANVIKLNTNENPYPPSPKVKEQCAKICAETEELRLYPDPTAGKAVRAAGRMPTHIYNAFCVLNNTAGLLGLEITGLRDKKTGREWPQRR